MATKYYGIKDNWTDDDVANVIEVASEDGTVSSVKVNGVEYGGGGGSSDFTSATITIKDPDEMGEPIEGPFVLDGTNQWDVQFPDTVAVGGKILSDAGGTEWSVEVPLYNGVAMLQLSAPIFNSTISGNLTKNGSYIKVTGNGVINIIGE